ncbi:unnamed protein product [Cercopithifilaria johnstoni]|uniref:C2H2-type domain-containing protein n=1 Tax=Cercopithifilaria johnstoni TaxID=2874296 RepID=A0A8J2MC71_9BILA|nr:unnamed protein product [Cercopithifilaria johnstoni]
MKAHELTHNNIRPFKCEQCGKNFTRNHSLKKHVNIHKCSSEKLYSTSSNLNRNKSTHDEVRRFKCEICDKAFKGRHCLMRHMKTHTDEKTEKCNLCDKAFKHRSALQRHKLTHENALFECKQCGKNFTRIHNLKKHMNTHKSSSEKLYSTVSSLINSIAEDIIDTEILIMEILEFTGI